MTVYDSKSMTLILDYKNTGTQTHNDQNVAYFYFRNTESKEFELLK